jgi:hypothetical protein
MRDMVLSLFFFTFSTIILTPELLIIFFLSAEIFPNLTRFDFTVLRLTDISARLWAC